MRCVRHYRGVGLDDCCAADREQAHAYIDRRLARNLRTVRHDLWSGANSLDAAKTVRVSLLAIWRAAAADRCTRCVRQYRGVRFDDCCAADREQAHSYIDRRLARNLRTVRHDLWSGANSLDAAKTVRVSLLAIWRAAAANRCTRCVRQYRGVRFDDCCAADREQTHSYIDRRLTRNLRTVRHDLWPGANSLDAAKTVRVSLLAIWRAAAANRCMRCGRQYRGVRFDDCCAADREQAHAYSGSSFPS
ncbi:hypothetical protein FX982_02694 [Pseudomonas graminis]|uniref:Uncharacterized protein n=1 Tax=Pseudomonas graminis TaxID=158627 RepID=A0A6M8MSK2_9PSED|nr:hypothetical protein FX982_02694 [Pseudomonas graminis]